MKIDRQINKIIEDTLPAILNGQATIDSILEKYPQYAAELRPRLEALIWLKHVRFSVATRPGFITDSRKYIETKLEAMPHTGYWQRLFWRYSPQRWVFNMAAPVVIIILLALITNSIVLTARLSIPGDALYSTKLFLEDLQLAFTFNPANKTDLYIQFSRERTTEFVELVLEGDYEVLPTAAERMETEILASIHSLNNMTNQDMAEALPKTAELKETLSNEISMLDILQASSPPYAHPGIQLAIQDAQSGLMAMR